MITLTYILFETIVSSKQYHEQISDFSDIYLLALFQEVTTKITVRYKSKKKKIKQQIS